MPDSTAHHPHHSPVQMAVSEDLLIGSIFAGRKSLPGSEEDKDSKKFGTRWLMLSRTFSKPFCHWKNDRQSDILNEMPSWLLT